MSEISCNGKIFITSSHFSCDRRNFAFHLFFAVVMATSCVNQRVLVNSYMVELNKALKNKAMTNFTFRNFSMETVIECFFACLEDCLCLSFQMCNETECHLLSSNQYLSTLVTKMECTYYDMRPTASQQVRNLLLVLKKNRMNLITWKNEVGLDIGLDWTRIEKRRIILLLIKHALILFTFNQHKII